jgi:hypothetical protein
MHTAAANISTVIAPAAEGAVDRRLQGRPSELGPALLPHVQLDIQQGQAGLPSLRFGHRLHHRATNALIFKEFFVLSSTDVRSDPSK